MERGKCREETGQCRLTARVKGLVHERRQI
jgi:hypothetical protein